MLKHNRSHEAMEDTAAALRANMSNTHKMKDTRAEGTLLGAQQAVEGEHFHAWPLVMGLLSWQT